jgi:limonene-1,2-epoxide hydrolase
MFRKMTLVMAPLAISMGVPGSGIARTRATEVSEVPIAMQFLKALGRLDFDAAAKFLNADAVLDLPYVNNGLIVHGREDILQFFRRSMSMSVASIDYRVDQVYPSSKAGSIALEISTQGRTAAGREYTNRLVGIFQFQDGKIVLFREYFNQAKIQ